MGMKSKISCIGAVIFVFVSMFFTCPLWALDNSEPLAQPFLPMVRAMGGAFTAVANDENAVFYNPAGYALVKGEIITVFSLGIKVNIDDAALKLYNAYISGEDPTASGNLDKYLSDTTIAPGIAGPIYFGRVGNNFGFAFYDNISITMDTRPGGLLPSAQLDAYTDIGFIGGYGRELPFLENFYAGFNLKVLLRAKSSIEGTVLEVIDQVSDTSEIPISKAVGFGGDIGLLYFPNAWLSVALCAKDFFGTRFSSWEALNQSTPFERSLIKPRIVFGLAFYPLIAGGETKNFKNFIIALDYSDLLDYTSIFTNVKLGIGFDTLRILRLRSGFDGGYPTFGIGFDLNVFQMNIVYFVDELGAYTGAQPVQNLMLNFAFRW